MYVFLSQTAWRQRRAALLVLLATSLSSLAPLHAAPPPGARPGSGKISVSSQPPGANVMLDGHPYGKTPVTIEGLGSGLYFLRLELAGYRGVDSTVNLGNAQSLTVPPIALSPEGAPVPAPPPVVPAATPAPVVRATPAPVPPPAPAPVVPAPAPAVSPAPPVPEPAPPAPITPTAPEAPAGDEDETVRQLVGVHLETIVSGDITSFLRLCAPKVDLYEGGPQSHDTVRRTRQKFRERWPKYEITNVRDLAVKPGENADQRRALVTYDWAVSNPKTGKKADGTAKDTIDFKKIGGRWLIVKTRQAVERKTKAD